MKSEASWGVWMQMPEPAGGGWSRIAAGLDQEAAERFAEACLFKARATREQED